MATDTFEHRLDVALTVDTPATLRQTIMTCHRPRRSNASIAGFPSPARLTSSGLLTGLTSDRPAIIGRSRPCDLLLIDDPVSRRHARAIRDGDPIILTDLESTSRTLVSDRQITQAEVRPGDRLRPGGLDLVL